MKKFYCVATIIHSNGEVQSNVVSSKFSDEIPKASMDVTEDADYYYDWFEKLKDANEFVELTKKK